MSGNLFCVLAFATSFVAARISLVSGLIFLLIWGYFFGILKANYVATNGLFIFDAATIGFYLGSLLNPKLKSVAYRYKPVFPWVSILIAWPVFMSLVPIQHYLVQFIGLRGNIFWLPMILVGFLLSSTEKTTMVFSLSVLNIVALCFAVAEFLIGVEYFVPDNEVTRIVYSSNDLKDGAKRIPSIFANAHSYSLFMVATIPWIIGEITHFKREKLRNYFRFPILVTGLVCALLGIFIAGPRQPVVVLSMLLMLILFSRGFNLGFVLIVVFVSIIVGFFAISNVR